MQQFESKVHFRCPACRASNFLEVPVPEFDFAVENMSDLTSEGESELWCEHCESEFPATVWCNSSYCQFTLDEHPEIVITGDAPFYNQADDDFWVDYDPPEDPFGICVATLDQMVSLITDKPTHKDDPQLLNRMVLSQAVTALETYLFDTLVRRISSDRSLIVRLLERDKHINQEKFTLRAIATNEKLLDDEIKKYLGGVLYHNLERVKFLYDATFGFSIKSDESDWSILLEAIERRHDCVHRNGLSPEGKRLLVFTRDYVVRVIGAVQRLVQRIENCLLARDHENDDLPF
jgi:hypothetical protein